MHTALFTLFFALFARIALAVPPACLLHAVNTQDEPGNMSAICGNGASTVQSHMANNCGSFASDAQKAFIATCSSAGTSVAAYSASANSTSSATRSSSSSTGTGMVTSSARISGATSGATSGTTSGTPTGSASSTHSTAGANGYYRQGVGSMAAAAVALVGAVAAL